MLVETEMVGKSTFGSAATGRNGYPASPTRTIASVNAVVMTGRWMQSVGSDIASAPFPNFVSLLQLAST